MPVSSLQSECSIISLDPWTVTSLLERWRGYRNRVYQSTSLYSKSHDDRPFWDSFYSLFKVQPDSEPINNSVATERHAESCRGADVSYKFQVIGIKSKAVIASTDHITDGQQTRFILKVCGSQNIFIKLLFDDNKLHWHFQLEVVWATSSKSQKVASYMPWMTCVLPGCDVTFAIVEGMTPSESERWCREQKLLK